MAITINDGPQDVVLSKNPLLFDISTEEYVITGGQYAQISIAITLAPNAGDTLTFTATVLDPDVEFTCAVSPDYSHNEFPEQGSMSNSEFIENHLIPALMANPTLSEHYEMWKTATNNLVLKSRVPSADSSISAAAVGFSITTSGGTGIDPEFEDPYSVRCRATLLVNSLPKLGPWLYFSPDENGDLVIDLSDHLTDMMGDDFYRDLVMTGTTPYRNDFVSAKTLVTFAEHYGDTPLDSINYPHAWFYMLKGGFRTQDKGETLMNAFHAGEKFLTNRPSDIITDKRVYDWLHIAFKDVSETINRLSTHFKIYFKNGETQDTIDSVYQSALTDYTSPRQNPSVYTIPCGYSQCSLEAWEGGRVPYKYEVWINDDAANTISEVKTFWLAEESKHANYLHYFNSFGLMEALYLEGESSMEVEMESEGLRLPNPYEYSEDTRVNQHFGNRLKPALVFSTGAINQGMRLALQDLLLSPWVYVMRDIDAATRFRISGRIDPDAVQLAKRVNGGDHSHVNIIRILLNDEDSNSNINEVWQ